MKKLLVSVAVISTLALAGCFSIPTIPVNYAPTSIKSSAGSLSVSDFSYFPSRPTAPKAVASNEIRTSFWDIRINRDVSKFIRDAVFSELRVVGIKTNDSSKVLSGEVEEFVIDDLIVGFDWTLRIKYTLTDATSKKIIFSSIKSTQRKTGFFTSIGRALNETIKINIEQLIDDVEFVKAIQ